MDARNANCQQVLCNNKECFKLVQMLIVPQGLKIQKCMYM